MPIVACAVKRILKSQFETTFGTTFIPILDNVQL